MARPVLLMARMDRIGRPSPVMLLALAASACATAEAPREPFVGGPVVDAAVPGDSSTPPPPVTTPDAAADSGMVVTDDAAPPPVRTGIVADPSAPGALYYDDGMPLYVCGPGDPEGSLYRGARRDDGTRDGDQLALIDKLARAGANGIYFQAIRSHGGDGERDHNPFVDSDPARGLDDDILDQWDTWLRAMDDAGIVAYFFIYDDSACIWDCGNRSVPAGEAAFLEALVTRFSHIGHLIWVVAEEYQERFSAARVAAIASVIRQADERPHPIAVHKLLGDGFDEFRSDPNIDQFSMQTEASSPQELHARALAAVRRAMGDYHVNVSEAHVSPDGHGTGTTARRNNWATALSGAHVMALGWDIASAPNEDLEACGHLVRFMEGTRFDLMVSDDGRAQGDTDYVLARGSDELILYAEGRSADMAVTGMVPGDYDVTYMDTESGETVFMEAVSVSEQTAHLVPPGVIDSDVAIHLQRRSP